MPPRQKAASFENSVSPETAASYRRLRRSKRVADATELLKRRGMTDETVEILFRNIASIVQEWRSDNESWKQAEQRRSRLAKKLRTIGKEVALDPDLGGLGFEIGKTVYATSLEDLNGVQSLAQFLEIGISFLESNGKPRVCMPSGEALTFSEFERRFRPSKRMPLKSYVLFAIFDLLHSFPALSGPDKTRSLNKEAEILASVLLKQKIRPGTVTQLRKKVRRRYTRDE